MLACKVFITDALRNMNNPAVMAVIERQVVSAFLFAGGDPLRVLWMEEEESHWIPEDQFPECVIPQTGRYRVYFEVPA
jgi:hypothetical protein